MQLTTLDWLVVAAYGAVALATGLYFARRAGSGRQEFFLSGRKLPWWLLGTSMVATTFSTDTPNLVTDIVRTNGVSGNWLWWAFLITGMCTVFFYAKLWRRSGVLTDMGFYELRYDGKPAAFLRGFRAIYLGVFFNVMIMATVTLAAIKISGVLLGIDKYTTVLAAATLTAVYSATSGLWGVVMTDLLLFTISMIGSLSAAYFALQRPEVGGLAGLVAHPELQGRLSLLPDFNDWTAVSAVLIVPLAVQWWSTWYPGAEPGGGGYVAQRMLAARNERESAYATLWFNVAHYALRPWPWILVALCSVLVYPTLDSIQQRFPGLDPAIVGHDLAYPAMLVFLPSGAPGAGGGVAGRSLHVDDQHASQLGCLVHGGRLLSALLGAGSIRDPLRRRRALEHRRPGGSRVGGGPVARDGAASLSDSAANRRRDRLDLPDALVLVAHQRLGRDRGHGDLLFRCALLRARPRGARHAGLGRFGATRVRRGGDDGGLVYGHLADTADRYRHPANVLRAHPPRSALGGAACPAAYRRSKRPAGSSYRRPSWPGSWAV